jgi:iron complex transport system ATP-binding protein
MLRATDVTFAYTPKGRPAGRPRTPRAADARGDGTAHLTLDRVTLEVRPGSIVGLLGPNGAGKTTLLRILAGMLRPLAGTVTIEGTPLDALGRRALARRIAVVPQETRAAFDFTVLEIVLMGRYAHLGPFELEGISDLEIAREALAATGADQLAKRRFETLSGGEKQRVIIASALAQSPELLLLDEPTASLDLAYQLDVGALLRRLNRLRGTTMVLSTHDLNLAAAVCDDVVLLRAGRVIGGGPVNDMLTSESIRSTYGVEAEVRFHPEAGRLSVVPIGRER